MINTADPGSINTIVIAIAIPAFQKSVIDFSLGLLSRDNFYNYAIFIGVGGPVRQLIRNNSVQNARKLARKALKRRGILNRQNLTNPRVYAQL